MKNLKNSATFWKIASVTFFAIFVLTQAYAGSIHFNNMPGSGISIVKVAHANDLYPMFSCPCCGEPLNKEDPCCGAMSQMTNYIDEKVLEGLSEEEIILATAKEFGMERLINEKDRTALKQKLIDLAPEDAPRIEISGLSHDLGTVSQKQGIVTTDFEFKNVGKSDLSINKLSSSCGCTSASVVYKGEVGPEFAMEGHGKENPENWEVMISPGDSAVLRVFYDPSVHPDLEGAVTRTVSIMSNDPVEFETQVAITLDQTK